MNSQRTYWTKDRFTAFHIRTTIKLESLSNQNFSIKKRFVLFHSDKLDFQDPLRKRMIKKVASGFAETKDITVHFTAFPYGRAIERTKLNIKGYSAG